MQQRSRRESPRRVGIIASRGPAERQVERATSPLRWVPLHRLRRSAPGSPSCLERGAFLSERRALSGRCVVSGRRALRGGGLAGCSARRWARSGLDSRRLRRDPLLAPRSALSGRQLLRGRVRPQCRILRRSRRGLRRWKPARYPRPGGSAHPRHSRARRISPSRWRRLSWQSHAGPPRPRRSSGGRKHARWR